MVDNNPGPTASASFPPDQHAVSRALDMLESFLDRHPVGDETQARLAIIVEELVANIVEHGRSPADQPIALTLRKSGPEISLVLSDGGISFDCCAPVVPAEAPPDRGGGAGLAMVQRWASTMAHVREDGRNILKLAMALDR